MSNKTLIKGEIRNMITTIKPVQNRQKSKDIKESLNRTRKKFITMNYTERFNDVEITYGHESYKSTRSIIVSNTVINGFIIAHVVDYAGFKKNVTLCTGWNGKGILKPNDKLTFAIAGKTQFKVNSDMIIVNIERAKPNDNLLFIMSNNCVIGCFTEELYSHWDKLPSVNLLDELNKLNPFNY